MQRSVDDEVRGVDRARVLANLSAARALDLRSLPLDRRAIPPQRAASGCTPHGDGCAVIRNRACLHHDLSRLVSFKLRFRESPWFTGRECDRDVRSRRARRLWHVQLLWPQSQLDLDHGAIPRARRRL